MASSQSQVITERILALRIDVDSKLDGEPGIHAGGKDVTDQALEQGNQKTPISIVVSTEAFLEDAEIALDEKHEELDNVVTGDLVPKILHISKETDFGRLAWWTTAHTIQPGLIDRVDDNVRACKVASPVSRRRLILIVSLPYSATPWD